MKPLRFALLGDPVGHSKSPPMHAAAYRAQKLPHTYEAIRVTADELARKVQELRDGVFAGLNVTVPHKRRILEHVDAVHPSARIAGAANTLVRQSDGTIMAFNTDAPALADEIRMLAPEVAADPGGFRDKVALVIGAGGAARSAIVALGIDLSVARIVLRARPRGDGQGDRTAAFAEEMSALLAEAGSSSQVVASPFAASQAIDSEVCVVVQATSAGMTGAEPGEGVASVVAWGELPARAIALDVVYAPPVTPFLSSAQQHGIRAANGIGMLARQGALAFQLWLGGSIPYNAMLTALV